MTTPLIILGLLFLPVLSARFLYGAERVPLGGLIGISLAFAFFGVGHFVQTDKMVEMLPSFVPFKVPLVLVTGVLELAIAFTLLRPSTRWNAGLVAVLVLVGFFPVNVFAAFNHIGMGGHAWGPVYLLLRAPLQALLIWWIWYFVLSKEDGGNQRSQSPTGSHQGT